MPAIINCCPEAIKACSGLFNKGANAANAKPAATTTIPAINTGLPLFRKQIIDQQNRNRRAPYNMYPQHIYRTPGTHF